MGCVELYWVMGWWEGLGDIVPDSLAHFHFWLVPSTLEEQEQLVGAGTGGRHQWEAVARVKRLSCREAAGRGAWEVEKGGGGRGRDEGRR